MTKKEGLERDIIDFVFRQSGAFQLQDILDAVEHPGASKKKAFSKRDITDILTFKGIVFSEDVGIEEIPQRFIPRHVYFKNARFMVFPRTEEIAQGILIPGHRFIPFLYPKTNPWDCTLVTAEGDEASCKIVSQRLEDLAIHYTLLGLENMEHLLALDQETNDQVLFSSQSAPNDRVRLTVFDFTKLYRTWHLVPEDGMLFEVRDWLNGIYMVRYVSKEEGQELRSHGGPWVAKLEQGFQRTFDTFGIRIPIDEQIAYSYYYGGRELLQDPPLHLGGFLEASHRVYIIPFGMQTRVWHEKEFNFDQVYALVTDVPKKKGFAGLLEGICAPCSVAEVEAFIQDELFRCKGLVKEEREDDYFNAVITRIFGDDTKFFTDWQWQELFKYFQKLWEKAAKSYNYFKDQVTGKARSSVITILEAYYGWFRTLSTMEVMPQEIPMQMMTSLSQAHSTLVDYLWLVDNSDEEEQHDIRSLTEILPAVNTSLESLKQYVLDHITAGRKQTGNSKLRLVRPSDLEEAPPAEPKHIFVLRISLKGITPQIWRSVQVPGSFTLGDLHYVIQDAMGWDDAHLHQFEINAVRYGPKGELDFSNFDMEDEDDYTLDDLGLVEKQRFFYTYDFEDDWIHQILVSKILPSEGFSQEDQQYPRCLKGKRACPPEDCGGINGYEEILEALAGPKKKKSRELLEWVGDFDPEYFDVDQVNTRLQSDDDEDEASNEDE